MTSNHPGSLDTSLGRQLRAARVHAGLTMAALAQRAGISQPHLSQMEHGKVSPSISALYRIASALGVTPQELLPAAAEAEMVIVRAGEGDSTRIVDAPDAAIARVLLGSPERVLQVQEIVVEPGEQLGGWFEHEGEEFLYVLAGDIELEVRGHEPHTLGTADSAWYRSDIPHRWVSYSSGSVRVLAVSAALATAKPARTQHQA